MTQERKTRLNPEEMKARIEDLARKDELSAIELRELVYLIFKKTLIDDGLLDEDSYDNYQVYLPAAEDKMTEVEIVLAPPDNEEPWVEITFADGLEHTRGISGEKIVLGRKGQELVWRVGFSDSAYSELLGKRVELTGNLKGVMESVVPLTPGENAKMAKKIFEAYQTPPSQPQETV